MERKRRKTLRGPYKLYLQSTENHIPKQTLSRWRESQAKLPADLSENLSEHFSEDCEELDTPVSHHASYEESSGMPDDEGNSESATDDDGNSDHQHNQMSEDDDLDIFYDALPPHPDEPDDWLYNGAPITKTQSSTMIMAFVIRHGLTGSAVQDLLTLLNEHLPLPSVPPSNYLLRKYSMTDIGENDIVYHGYCNQCTAYLGVSDELVCANCETTTAKANVIKNGDFFASLSMKSQLRNLLEMPSVYSMIRQPVNYEDGTLEDLQDGKLYRETVHPGSFSLTFNSDGISAFQSSNGSVWPILCTLNELPPKERKKHVMLAGIWFGGGKPNMQVYLKGFVEECDSMARDGLDWQNPTTHHDMNSKVYAITCVCDSVARCQLQGLVQFNGYFGCNWCLHPSERFEGVKHVYPSNQLSHELRTREHFVEKAVLARRTGQNQYGVKPNPSQLLLLPKFNIVSGFAVDYMHAVCEGVVEKLVSLWFDSCHSQEPWYIGRRVKEVDGRIESIVPPSEVTRLPASPSKRAFWKASEFRCWLLFYFLPILNGILPSVYLKHLVLLIHSIWLLTKSKIRVADIEMADTCLKNFVRKIERLYGVQHMSFNNHILLHLPNTVLNWGPLWASSCFLFEGYNRKLKSLFHGTRGVAHQIVNNFMMVQNLTKQLNMMGEGTPPAVTEYIKAMLRGYPLLPSVTKVENDEDILFQGNGSLFHCENQEVRRCIGNYFEEQFCDLRIAEYAKVFIAGVKYEKAKCNSRSKRSDSFVVYGSNKIGKILNILHVQQQHVIFVVRPLLIESNEIAVDNETGACAEHIVKVTDEPLLPPFILQPSTNLAKCVKITVNGVSYCCILPNMVELD